MAIRMRKQKYPRQKLIAVDVDGTLFVRGALNIDLAEWCKQKKSEGFRLMLWSARGQSHAEEAAYRSDLEDVFDIVIRCRRKPLPLGRGWIATNATPVNFAACLDPRCTFLKPQ